MVSQEHQRRTQESSSQELAPLLDAVAVGLPVNRIGLDFKQCSLCHITRVLHNDGFSIFSPSCAFRPCYCSRCLSARGKAGDPEMFLRISPVWDGDTASVTKAHLRLVVERHLIAGAERHFNRVSHRPYLLISAVPNKYLLSDTAVENHTTCTSSRGRAGTPLLGVSSPRKAALRA